MTPARTAEVALIAGLLIVTSIAVVGVATAAQPSITNVTVSPQEPQPGELVRFTTTVQNAQGSGGSFEVTDVVLRAADGSREYTRAEDLGTIPPGASLQVPLTVRFGSDGVKELRIQVTGLDENDRYTTLRYPVTVVVSDRGTQLSIDVDEPVVGETSEVNVTVSNGGADPIRQLDLRIGGDGVDAENPRRLLARLEPGADRTFPYDVTFTRAGETDIEAALQYTSASGQSRTARQSESIEVEELREDVSVDARMGEDGGANPPLLVEVTNFGNARLEDVSVRVSDGDRTVARRALEPVAAGGSREVRMNLSGVDDADLDVTAVYETGGRDGEASTTVRYSSRPGRIVLTGVDFDQDGGVTTISGSASNVGLSEVNSVVLTVLPAEGVEPVSPNREYFVGTVPASDFVSFDLTARVTGNVSSIPLSVTYVAGGVEKQERISVPYESAGSAQETPSDDGGGLLPVLVGLVIVAAVGAIVYVGWRNRGGE